MYVFTCVCVCMCLCSSFFIFTFLWDNYRENARVWILFSYFSFLAWTFNEIGKREGVCVCVYMWKGVGTWWGFTKKLTKSFLIRYQSYYYSLLFFFFFFFMLLYKICMEMWYMMRYLIEKKKRKEKQRLWYNQGKRTRQQFYKEMYRFFCTKPK